jgi:hypothetical protein
LLFRRTRMMVQLHTIRVPRPSFPPQPRGAQGGAWKWEAVSPATTSAAARSAAARRPSSCGSIPTTGAAPPPPQNPAAPRPPLARTRPQTVTLRPAVRPAKQLLVVGRCFSCCRGGGFNRLLTVAWAPAMAQTAAAACTAAIDARAGTMDGSTRTGRRRWAAAWHPAATTWISQDRASTRIGATPAHACQLRVEIHPSGLSLLGLGPQLLAAVRAIASARV